jgi:hypothetical protein
VGFLGQCAPSARGKLAAAHLPNPTDELAGVLFVRLGLSLGRCSLLDQVFLPEDHFANNPNTDGIADFVADAVCEARFGLITGLCK